MVIWDVGFPLIPSGGLRPSERAGAETKRDRDRRSNPPRHETPPGDHLRVKSRETGSARNRSMAGPAKNYFTGSSLSQAAAAVLAAAIASGPQK
jgi:hypothetical protein